MPFGDTSSDESIKNIELTWWDQIKNSDEIRQFFSSDYIEAVGLEMCEISSEQRMELVKLRFDFQKEQNIEKLDRLKKNLDKVNLKIQDLKQLLNQSISHPSQVENAKQAVNESMKFASVFAQEKEYETHRGAFYLAIKEQYQKQIYPAYNAALLEANQVLSQSEAKMIDQLYRILDGALNDDNIRTFWSRQVGGKMSAIDASKVNNFSVPRGIYNARIELNKLNEEGSNKAEVVRMACLRMQERLDENDKEKPTAALYLAIDNLLNENGLALTAEKLSDLMLVLVHEMFGSVSKSIKELDFSLLSSRKMTL